MKAIACLGFWRTTDVKLHINKADITRGYKQVPCFECVVRGVWDYFTEEIPAHPCVVCKGTGNVYINC
jgi:hypothetical protein